MSRLRQPIFWQAAALLLGVVLLLILFVPAEAAFTGGNGKIAFQSSPGPIPPVYDIFVMDSNSFNQVNLTNSATFSDFDPAFSPDGTKIAFTTNRDGNQEIYVMNADGTGALRLTNDAGNDVFPAWSPDGTKLAFVSNRDGDEEIWVMNAADGTGLLQLTSNTTFFDRQPSWKPDGTKIAFVSNRDADEEIYIMNAADGTSQTRLTASPGFDRHPDWKPDGSLIAFFSRRSGKDQIYTMDNAGGSVTNLTNNAGFHDSHPSWSPDGTRIVFNSCRDSGVGYFQSCDGTKNHEIYVMNANGSNQTRLTHNLNTLDVSADWQPATPIVVGATCTTDCYVSPLGSDANSGASAVLPLKSIQLALDTVSNNGTVHLAAGEYFENSNKGWVELEQAGKSLTMVGAGSGVSIVQLPIKTNGLRFDGVNLDITIEGITFTRRGAAPFFSATAAGFNIRIGELGATSLNSLTLTDVESAYAGGRNVIMHAGNTFSDIEIEDSNFHHAGSWGFSIAGTANDITVTNSHFDNNGQIDWIHGVGLDFEASGGTTNVLITGGTFNNNAAGVRFVKTTDATITGIEATGNYDGAVLWEYLGTSSNVTIEDSNLSGNSRGVLIGSETSKMVDGLTITGNQLNDNALYGVLVYREAGWGEGAIKNVHINRNNLNGNPTQGIAAPLPYEEVDGMCNWWGNASGPGPVGPGSGSKVTTGVDFTPWLYASDLSGPCYVGGAISIDKVAAGAGALEFEFDVSWSATNVKLTDASAPYVTAPPLPAGTYSISEVNLPAGWALDSATCDNTVTTPVEDVNPSNISVADGDAWVCTFTNKPMGTIQIVKSAPDGGALEFEFDVSWSATNVKLTDGQSTTPVALSEGNYSIIEVNLPLYWINSGSTCLNGPETASASNIPLENGDAWVCTFNNVYAPSNTCPVGAASNEWTDLLGIGMGDTKSHKVQAKIVIPNYLDLAGLYGQMIAKDEGKANSVRFIMPGKGNYVEVNTITSPIAHQFGNFWYGAELPGEGVKSVTGKWFLQTSGVKRHIPRALVLYPTYTNPAQQYVNVWSTYGATEGEVYWDVAQGWTPARQIVLDIPAPLAATTFNVELALVDNEKDARPVYVTVSAGGVSQTQKPTGPNKGNLLNIMSFTLANVPAGTDEIVIDIVSPAPYTDGLGKLGGDSAMVVGAAANYLCEEITTVP